jgi:hypothetical protein
MALQSVCRHESKEMSPKRQMSAKKPLWNLLVEQADRLLVVQADRDARGLEFVAVCHGPISTDVVSHHADNDHTSRTGITIEALTPV